LGRKVEAEASRRIHGHTYYAEVSVMGEPDAHGMVMDLGLLRAMAERIRQDLDHRMLNEVEGLGIPTLENLCAFLWRRFQGEGCAPSRIVVRRDAMGDSCVLSRP
jgi:6-pyruvoyltetrahydropterin/6-carboxytetrahydropterin synthase